MEQDLDESRRCCLYHLYRTGSKWRPESCNDFLNKALVRMKLPGRLNLLINYTLDMPEDEWRSAIRLTVYEDAVHIDT
jgi:hypothetical protein